MSDEQETIQQLLHEKEVPQKRLSELRRSERYFVLPKKLCELGATFKGHDLNSNRIADDCFVVALQVTELTNAAEHRKNSEREAWEELTRLAIILDATVGDLPAKARRVKEQADSQPRHFSIDKILHMDARTRNIIVHSANSFGCETLDAVARLKDDQFLSLRGCGASTLKKIREALSFQ